MAWTDPKTWTGSAILYASELNTYLRDNQKALTEWQDYTPTWTAASSNPSIGNGSLQGRYIQAGDLVHWHLYLYIGSTTTFGSGNWRLGLPVTSAGAGLFLRGHALIHDSGSTYWHGHARYSSTTTVIVSVGKESGGGAECESSWPMAWASGDSLRISGTYEAA